MLIHYESLTQYRADVHSDYYLHSLHVKVRLHCEGTDEFYDDDEDDVRLSVSHSRALYCTLQCV